MIALLLAAGAAAAPATVPALTMDQARSAAVVTVRREMEPFTESAARVKTHCDRIDRRRAVCHVSAVGDRASMDFSMKVVAWPNSITGYGWSLAAAPGQPAQQQTRGLR